jgi:hypothetical protein
VIVSQVLYDPLGSESGGEAVELRNDGTALVDVSGWTLATETSATDATIPASTMLAAGSTYLIADAGWSAAKDNPLWRAADLEETLTMANANSGIALKDAAGMIVDAVGWGDPAEIKPGLWEGAPAAEVAAGKALVRQQDTDNNAADFSEGEPALFAGETVLLVVNVTNATLATPLTPLPLGAALNEDDSAEPGVQLKPVAGGTRTLHLEVNYSGTRVFVGWFGKSVELVSPAAGRWTGELPLEYWYAPGAQQIAISTPTQNSTLAVTILELKAAKLETKTVALQAAQGGTAKGTIAVKNQGNVPLDVSWTGSDLVFGQQKIPFSSLKVSDAVIEPAKSMAIGVALDVPASAVPGEYRTMLVMGTG